MGEVGGMEVVNPLNPDLVPGPLSTEYLGTMQFEFRVHMDTGCAFN